ncbi:molybdopterin molybdotransferase MoeA [Bacillus sp. 2205SS5-2]|uniref:molybdopterin molybdotransferase MoeA n=1 Tax=Bacillus sp. 2205SS5-2 TaxID=3109031 RepID=UPI0030075BE2
MKRRNPIKVHEAIEQVMMFAIKGEREEVSIHNALGRFLATDLRADHDVPSFNRSPYDGFAVFAEDTKSASSTSPITLKVVGEIGAGSVFEGNVERGQAVRIMTGAQIPSGCDAVVMLELARSYQVDNQNWVDINRSYKKGDNISFKGEETKKGSILVPKGTPINPGIIALLATFGYSKIPVGKRPKIGVIATGSELLTIDEPLQPGKIRNSNTYMALAQIERAGGEGIYFGQFEDNVETCYKKVKDALKEVDLLITTGGVSVGDYDYLPDIYKKIKAKVLFNKIGMRPGSVTTVAEKDGKLLFGLSGNPSACYVGFELLARPIIRTYIGNPNPYLKKVKGYLGVDFTKPNPFTRFIRGSIAYEEGKLVAYPSGLDKSSVVSSLAYASVFIELPGGTRGYERGREVAIHLLEDQDGQSKFDLPSK